ncbi:MAG: sigma-70 family RNA polymerase sigma factor [Verrucomicrobiota bacterium]
MGDFEDSSTDAEDYLRLLAKHERSLAAYVHSLVRSVEDAEDLLQECKVVMWKHFPKFEEGTNFLAWARKIAFHQILNYRRKSGRTVSSGDEAFLEAIAAEIDRRSDHLEERAEALQICLRKLPLAHRQTIVLRYFEDCEVDEIARKTDRSEGAVYRLLSRIRQTLNDCVTRTLRTATAS